MTDTIAELTARLKTEYESAREMFRRGAVHALNCGALLNRIKAELAHGKWLLWLASECPINSRTAQRWQRLANHRAQIEELAKTTDLADLAVSAAEKLIATRGKYESDEKEPMSFADAVCYPRKQQLVPEGFTVKGETRTIATQILDMQDELLAEAERDLEDFEFRYEAWPQLVQGARELRAMVTRIRKKEAKAKATTLLRTVH